MDQPWRIELFGWLRAVQAERVVARFRTRKAGALLAYLAYYSHRSHPRELLIELLWPGCETAAGRANLRAELTSLRHQLEPPGVPPGAVILADRDAVQLNPAACVTDVALFEAALTAAERATSPAKRAELLLAAAELYRGELLPGRFEDWILPERQQLAEAFLRALHDLVALLEQWGDRPRALHWARRAVAADPLHEDSHQLLIRLLVAAGQIEAARAQYEQGQHLLQQELGTGLSPEIRTLIEGLAPSQDRLSPGPPGKERKPRGRRPPGSSRELPATGPEPSPVEAAAARATDNLPLRFTRFFGREREIAALVEMLSSIGRPLQRLVTMTGPGGTGKTRLALQAAQGLRDAFPGGVWFVSLLDVTRPGLIPDQVLLALRLPRSPHREPLEQVLAFLSRAPALLLLDNFEHLLDGGLEIVQNLREQGGDLTILVTSRQRLNLEGEREFPVGPLPVPAEEVFGVRCSVLGSAAPQSEHRTPNT
jgi:DNA-binding SARP family transcriptional activator